MATADPEESHVHTTTAPEIEADSYSDTDSAYSDSDIASYTTSLSSSIFDYQYENGRRYHKFREGKYMLPNDEAEKDRLDMHHHMCVLVQNGKLHQSPIGDHPQQILDLGTGTGIWAIEIGDTYPSAVVTGNDLSPIQPPWVPPNVKFEVDDVESEWTYPENTFDLIYSRYLLGGIADWQKLISQAYKACKPGGYIEIMDPYSVIKTDDGTLPPDCSLVKWNEAFIDAANKAGRSLVEASEYKTYMQKAGFTDIHETILKLPNSPWPRNKHLKEVGAYHMASFLEALEGLTLRFFTHFLNYTVPEIHVMLANVRKDLKNKNYHSFYDLYVVYGRKPE